jgi:formylglycine-generating enzyme required for sulfatase activity
VTVGQFEAFVKDEGYQTDAERDAKGGKGFDEGKGKFEQRPEYTWRNPFKQGKDHPVVNVSWNDAVAFCK